MSNMYVVVEILTYMYPVLTLRLHVTVELVSKAMICNDMTITLEPNYQSEWDIYSLNALMKSYKRYVRNFRQVIPLLTIPKKHFFCI